MNLLLSNLFHTHMHGFQLVATSGKVFIARGS